MHQQAADIFQKLASDLDTEGRYLFLNALANQLRFPNNHTHYFSCILLYLFDQNAKVSPPSPSPSLVQGGPTDRVGKSNILAVSHLVLS